MILKNELVDDLPIPENKELQSFLEQKLIATNTINNELYVERDI